MQESFDVAIVGAGPYGLAAAAHLQRIRELRLKVFGEPMEFWKSYMPEGMLLRSPWDASHISDPDTALTMDAFSAASSEKVSTPIPLDRFVEYGLWFQSQTSREIDRRRVRQIRRDPKGFELTFDDDSQAKAHRVVIAAGIKSFARRPSQFDGFSSNLVSHVSDQRDIKGLAGKRVAVIGAGQSALESAALLHEAGAEVEVIVRAARVHWLGWKARIQKLGPIAKLLYSRYDIGPAGISRIVAIPNCVKFFPRAVQERFRVRALRPAGARWLADRCKHIRITTGSFVTSASETGEKVHLKLNDGSSREIDRVLLGTGYKVDISRYEFLPPELTAQLSRANGFPRVNAGFESSLPGLHFLGAPSAWTFGPLMYFVCGTDFAARTLTRYIAAVRSGSATSHSA